MARIKLGPVVTDIAGSIGGATIQRSRFGITMRAKPLPRYTETTAQYNVRQKIASLQASWQALTDAQRLQWNRFLDFSGATIRRDRSILLSGHSLYLKYQLFRLLYNQSLLTTIAYSPMPTFAEFHNIRKDGSTYYVFFKADVVHTSYFFLLKLSSPRSPSKFFSPAGLRFMSVTLSTSQYFDITAAYIAAFGVGPPVASVLHYTIQYFSIVAPVYSGVYTGISEIVSA